jgi:hypothetical protein
MARRLKKTLLDYLVIAISPALIMTMVGSLVFFLIQVFYQGNFQGRLQYIFALFVMAAVLIARISIENGRERALLFAIPLGIVTLLAIKKFVQFQGGMLESLTFFINCGLIAVVWWSSDKLTWDCTLINEDEEDSGEGLLESVRMDRHGKASIRQEIEPSLPEIEATTSRDESRGWWQRFIDRRRRPHAPGVWVIYFSLAALPLFGVGQLFIPIADLSARQNAFDLLCVYTASGLGLLLATSFLGLRRYLRQRRQEMPLLIVNLWLTIGGIMIAGVMLLAMLLPRPNAEYAVSEPLFRIGSPDQRPSQNAQGSDGVKDKQTPTQSAQRDDRQSGSASPDRPGSRPSDKAEADKSDKTQSDKADKVDKTDKASSEKTDKADKTPSEKPPKKPPKATGSSYAGKQSTDNTRNQRQDGGKNSNNIPTARSLPQITFAPMNSILALFKWIFYLALAILILFAIWRNRFELLSALGNLVQWLMDFWHNLFGGKVRSADEAGDEESPRKKMPRPFADFTDPFAAGMAQRYAPAELVRYTFEAVEAWAWEHGQPRQADQTPHEFARCLVSKYSSLAEDAGRLADLYAQAAYAPVTLPAASVARLSHLWENLRTQGTAPLGSPT